MSIHGKGKELFIGKLSITIIDFMANKKVIEYSEISRIEYCYANGLEGGFLDIIQFTGKKIRFCFKSKVNNKITRAVEYISEHATDIAITEMHINNYPFYQHKWFILLITTFCCWPIGIILLLTSPLQNLRFKLTITLIYVSSFIIVYLYYFYTLRKIYETVYSTFGL